MQAIEFETSVHDGVIKLPDQCTQWEERAVKVILLAEEPLSKESIRRRQPHPEIAGKGKTVGDLIAPIVDDGDWDCLK